ncbi:transporter [Shewanella sairae]|uniref:Transporter n=1 Tax=Shewanella sairae TaxID=190310 RepID=A0ABQ4PLD8_9GAMM|nr:hypothetical protein [Shewanella sairae]MCL1131894.1 hypothetical protein [Shewanella sairae]GIU48874.1 transporter [Shewanella sairae]
MTFLNTISIDSLIPKYGRLVTEKIISLDDERLLAIVHVKGIQFETMSENLIHNYFLAQKNLFNSLAHKCGSRLALWTHIVKKKDSLDQTYEMPCSFTQGFADKYREMFDGVKLFTTDYYLSFVLKHTNIDNGIEELNEILDVTNAVLNEFRTTTLSIEERDNNVFYCENVSFLAYLLNNFTAKIPLSTDKITNIIPKSELHFGYDTLEIRNHESDTSRYGVLYELDAYPATTKAGMWDFILKAQYEFILSQSMIFINNNKAIKLLDDQINIADSVDNESEEQIEELEYAKGFLSSGDIAFGDYHAALVVFGKDVDEAIESGTKVASGFLNLGTSWKRSNIKSIFTYQSLLPASAVRPLSSPRTVTNLVCGFSLHNYSCGKKEGNAIGDGTALMPFKTEPETLYYFNSHASDHDKNVLGEKILGHALILGASGTGKTTLEGALVLFTTRFNPALFVIDYNRSTELYLRAVGGQYFAFSDGVDTGLNPFQLKDTPQLRGFLYSLVERCAYPTGDITPQDEMTIKRAVDAVMSLSHANRRFSVVLQSIPMGSDLRLRLSKWCHSENGKLAWALDSAENQFNPDDFNRIGFDTTTILEKKGDSAHPACEAILATLFFIKQLMQKEGQLLLTIVEEFWMPANFPLTQSLIMSVLKAGRLKNEFIYLISQSPEDAINCAIFPAIVQQTATKVLLPNPDANAAEYKKIGLNNKEVAKVLGFGKESRLFLVKQSRDAVVAKMDLYGFDDYLPIISGTTADISLCEKIRKCTGDNPKDWIPIFQHYKRIEKIYKNAKPTERLLNADECLSDLIIYHCSGTIDYEPFFKEDDVSDLYRYSI